MRLISTLVLNQVLVDSRERRVGMESGEIIRWRSELQVDGMVEWVPAFGDLCITVIPAPEPESKGGNLGLNLMSILPNMVSHQ